VVLVEVQLLELLLALNRAVQETLLALLQLKDLMVEVQTQVQLPQPEAVEVAVELAGPEEMELALLPAMVE
jgi:hypothetical protein